jgi:hypothetical protein
LTEDRLDDGITNYRESAAFTPAEKIALEYTELMALNPDRIDAGFYDRLREHYAEEEIVELGIFVGFNIGYHTFFGTLKFYPMFSPDGRLVSQAESEQLYGDKPVSLSGARS